MFKLFKDPLFVREMTSMAVAIILLTGILAIISAPLAWEISTPYFTEISAGCYRDIEKLVGAHPDLEPLVTDALRDGKITIHERDTINQTVRDRQQAEYDAEDEVSRKETRRQLRQRLEETRKTGGSE